MSTPRIVATAAGLDPASDILAQAPTAGLVRPAYALLRDAGLVVVGALAVIAVPGAS